MAGSWLWKVKASFSYTGDHFTLTLIILTPPWKFSLYVTDKAPRPSGRAVGWKDPSMPLEPELTIRNKFQKNNCYSSWFIFTQLLHSWNTVHVTLFCPYTATLRWSVFLSTFLLVVNPWRLGNDWWRTVSAMFSKEHRLQMNLPFPEMHRCSFLAKVLGQASCGHLPAVPVWVRIWVEQTQPCGCDGWVQPPCASQVPQGDIHFPSRWQRTSLVLFLFVSYNLEPGFSMCPMLSLSMVHLTGVYVLNSWPISLFSLPQYPHINNKTNKQIKPHLD